MEKIEVDAREILFFKENAPTSFVSLIKEALEEKGYSVNRTQIHREITTVKKNYLKVVIYEARRLIKAIKGVEYKPFENHVYDISSNRTN